MGDFVTRPHQIREILIKDCVIFNLRCHKNKMVKFCDIAQYIEFIINMDDEVFRDEWFNARSAIELINKNFKD